MKTAPTKPASVSRRPSSATPSTKPGSGTSHGSIHERLTSTSMKPKTQTSADVFTYSANVLDGELAEGGCSAPPPPSESA